MIFILCALPEGAIIDYSKIYPHFHSINGTAEATTLEKQSIDIITVGTAFHWFDVDKTKIEFQRILKNNGWVLLVWNVRNTESALIRDYENLLLKFSPEYKESSALNSFEKSAGKEFFSPNAMKTQSFKNVQYFDWNGFKGRLLSTSYSLRPGDSHFEAMLNELEEIFKRYEDNRKVEFLYNTKLYYGKIHE